VCVCVALSKEHLKLGLPYVLVSPDTSSFLAFVRASGRVFENRRFVLVFGPIRKYIRTLPTAKAYDGMGQIKVVSFQYKMSVTSQNAILVQHNFKHLSCRDFYTYLCSQDPRLVIFAHLQVCEKRVLFFDLDNMVTLFET